MVSGEPGELVPARVSAFKSPDFRYLEESHNASAPDSRSGGRKAVEVEILVPPPVKNAGIAEMVQRQIRTLEIPCSTQGAGSLYI